MTAARRRTRAKLHREAGSASAGPSKDAGERWRGLYLVVLAVLALLILALHLLTQAYR